MYPVVLVGGKILCGSDKGFNDINFSDLRDGLHGIGHDQELNQMDKNQKVRERSVGKESGILIVYEI